jgi:hypothetical protein
MDLSKEADATNRVSTENLTSLTSCWWPVIRAVNNGTHISDYSNKRQQFYRDVWYYDDSGSGGGDGSNVDDNVVCCSFFQYHHLSLIDFMVPLPVVAEV